jgi:hypothetical protein
MKFALQSVLFAVALSVALPAQADGSAPSASDIKRAADAFDRGREAYRAEEYVEAAEHFEAADGHAPSALALRFAIASRREAGQLARAATLATLALSRHPEDGELTELANTVVQEASASLYKVEVSCDEPCELVLDDKIVHGQRNVERVLFVEPGAHKLRASWSDNRNRSERLEATAGGSGDVSFFIPEKAPDATELKWDDDGQTAAPSADRGGWSPVVFWTGLGLTVAGGAASTFLGLRALNEPGRDAVRTACRDFTGTPTDCPEYKEGRANQLQANVAIGATSVVGVFTAITGLFLTDWGPTDPVQDSARGKKAPIQTAQSGLRMQPWFGVGETTTIGATGTF